MKSEINPCPVCGWVVEALYAQAGSQIAFTWHYLRCGACWYRTKRQRSKEHAIDAHNSNRNMLLEAEKEKRRELVERVREVASRSAVLEILDEYEVKE